MPEISAKLRTPASFMVLLIACSSLGGCGALKKALASDRQASRENKRTEGLQQRLDEARAAGTSIDSKEFVAIVKTWKTVIGSVTRSSAGCAPCTSGFCDESAQTSEETCARVEALANEADGDMLKVVDSYMEGPVDGSFEAVNTLLLWLDHRNSLESTELGKRYRSLAAAKQRYWMKEAATPDALAARARNTGRGICVFGSEAGYDGGVGDYAPSKNGDLEVYCYLPDKLSAFSSDLEPYLNIVRHAVTKYDNPWLWAGVKIPLSSGKMVNDSTVKVQLPLGRLRQALKKGDGKKGPGKWERKLDWHVVGVRLTTAKVVGHSERLVNGAIQREPIHDYSTHAHGNFYLPAVQ